MNTETIFEQLKSVLAGAGEGTMPVKDQPDIFYLNTNQPFKGKDMFFGSVQVKKNYVAYHLFPVYVKPELLDTLSPELRKRMQGKSCFNFKKELTEEQLQELKHLTEKGYAAFVEEGFISH